MARKRDKSRQRRKRVRLKRASSDRNKAQARTEDPEVTLEGFHAVCLVDLLGQKQKLEKWAELPLDGKLTPELKGTIHETLGAVLRCRDGFTQVFKEASKYPAPKTRARLSEEDKRRYDRIVGCDIRDERLGDTILLSALIPNKYGDLAVAAVHRILVAACSVVIESLADKQAPRGAFTIGRGAMGPDESFYGPALAEAHRVESKIARHPRVIVHPKVLEFLDERQQYSHDSRVHQAMAYLARDCRAMLTRDVDGCWMLDDLGQYMGQTPVGKSHGRNSVKKAYDFVCSEHERFQAEGNSKLALRYFLVQQYMENRLPLWQIDGGTSG